MSEEGRSASREDGQQAQQPALPAAGLMDGRIDVAVAAAVALFGAGLIMFSREIAPGSIPDPIGSDGMPQLIGIFLVFIGAIVAVRRALMLRTHPGNLVPADGGVTDEPNYSSSALRAFGLLATAFLWAFLLERVGYVPLTLLLVAGALASMGIRSPVKLILLPIGFVITVWALFAQLLNLNLPAGLLGELVERLF